MSLEVNVVNQIFFTDTSDPLCTASGSFLGLQCLLFIHKEVQ